MSYVCLLPLTERPETQGRTVTQSSPLGTAAFLSALGAVGTPCFLNSPPLSSAFFKLICLEKRNSTSFRLYNILKKSLTFITFKVKICKFKFHMLPFYEMLKSKEATHVLAVSRP